jgi:hypothetical protein
MKDVPTCAHSDWLDQGPALAERGRVICLRCAHILDYYGDPAGPIGTVHRFPDQTMALAIVAFLRPHLDAMSQESPRGTAIPVDLYGELVERLKGYFADRQDWAALADRGQAVTKPGGCPR